VHYYSSIAWQARFAKKPVNDAWVGGTYARHSSITHDAIKHTNAIVNFGLLYAK